MSSTVTTPIVAARLRQPNLKERVQIAEAEIDRDGFRHRRVAFRNFIRAFGTPAINMTMATCRAVLSTGRYLNVYESAELESARTGEDLETIVRRRLHVWYDLRKTVERIFGFDGSEHYAALNVGGPGAERYGSCCILVDRTFWAERSTCFGGDTIRAIFDGNGTQQISDDACLDMFSVGGDFDDIATLKRVAYLRSSHDHIRRDQLRTVIEDPKFMVEFHLYGPVTIDQITGVLMNGKEFDRCRAVCPEWERLGRPGTQEFDDCPDFVELMSMIPSAEVPFFVVD